MIVDSFTAVNCSFVTTLLPLKKGNINIGSITIYNVKDTFNEKGDEFGWLYEDGNLVSIELSQASSANIGSVSISNSILANHNYYYSFFSVDGAYKNFSVGDVFLREVTYDADNEEKNNEKNGIEINGCVLSKPINTLRVDGLYFNGVRGCAIKLFDNKINAENSGYYSINIMDINNVQSDSFSTGLNVAGFD